MDIFQLFDIAIEHQASDLHLVPDFFPAIRVNSELTQLRTQPVLSEEVSKTLLLNILTPEQKENLLANKEIDFGYEYKGNRFRANLYFSKGKIAGAFRLIGNKIKTVEELMLPSIFHTFSDYRQGLILVTGPTGEGKSSTLATVINEINNKYARHLITIEDPIEYVYPSGKSIVSQRELHQDTHSWSMALRSILREDPDVVLIGEMRDYETVQAALTIAETGHLVFSTLHTGSTPETINRIIDVFPAAQQNQIRIQLASVLKVVVAQRLIPNVDRTRRVPAIEMLFNTPAVSSVIRDGRIHMLDNILETGESEGQYLFEKYLIGLLQKGFITQESVNSYALRPNEVKKFLK